MLKCGLCYKNLHLSKRPSPPCGETASNLPCGLDDNRCFSQMSRSKLSLIAEDHAHRIKDFQAWGDDSRPFAVNRNALWSLVFMVRETCYWRSVKFLSEHATIACCVVNVVNIF